MSIRVHLCLDDPEAHRLLCRCGVVFVLHGEALKQKHIVSCDCGVVLIDPNETLHTVEVSKGWFGGMEKKIVSMYYPYIQMLSTKPL